MQEPSSPLAPLDPSRLQQQMQQPMGGGENVNRSMSASSIGSLDSTASLSQFNCSSGNMMDTSSQNSVEFLSQSQVENQWSCSSQQTHQMKQVPLNVCYMTGNGQSLQLSNQGQSLLSNMSSPNSTLSSNVPNSPLTMINPGTPSNLNFSKQQQQNVFMGHQQTQQQQQNLGQTFNGINQMENMNANQQQNQQMQNYHQQQQLMMQQLPTQRNVAITQQQQMQQQHVINQDAFYPQPQNQRQNVTYITQQQNTVQQNQQKQQQQQQQQQKVVFQVAASPQASAGTGRPQNIQHIPLTSNQPVQNLHNMPTMQQQPQTQFSNQQQQQQYLMANQQQFNQPSPQQQMPSPRQPPAGQQQQQQQQNHVMGQSPQMMNQQSQQQQQQQVVFVPNQVQQPRMFSSMNQQRQAQVQFTEQRLPQQQYQNSPQMAQNRMQQQQPVVQLQPGSQQQNPLSPGNLVRNASQQGQMNIPQSPSSSINPPTVTHGQQHQMAPQAQGQQQQQQQQHPGRPNVPQMYIIGGGGGGPQRPAQMSPRFVQQQTVAVGQGFHQQQPQPSSTRGGIQMIVPPAPAYAAPNNTAQAGGVFIASNVPAHGMPPIAYHQQQQPQQSPNQPGQQQQQHIIHVNQQVVNNQQQPQQQQIRPPAAVQQTIQYFGHDPNFNASPDACLVGCSFLILDYERLLDQKEISDWRICIVQHGGEVENAYSNKCTHIVCDSLRNSVVQQALKESKRCVSAQWLNDCIQIRRMQPPWKIVHFPSHYGDNKPCKNKIFTVSGFDVNERVYIRQMITAVGARYTSYLSRHNTLLIAKCLDGDKVIKAVEWKIPVVNVQWLYDLFLGQQGALQSLNNPKYHQFLTKEALQLVNLDLFRIDYGASPVPLLMAAWRSPIQVTPECWKLAVDRRQKLEEDTKLFPYKKLRLSPAPDDDEIRFKRQDLLDFPGGRPKIAFTGLYSVEVENLTKKALWLGAIVESSVKECTHLIALDLKRTRKLLEGLALGRFVVSPLWIRQSFKQQRLLDCLEFIVKDEGNEKFFGFNIKLSIFKARQKPLFEDLLLYLTPSVQPSPSILTDLIQTSGGTVLQQKPSTNKILEFQQSGVQVVIITCENDIHLCQHWLEFGIVVHSAEFVLTGVLRQEVDFQSYRIEPSKSPPSSTPTTITASISNNNSMVVTVADCNSIMNNNNANFVTGTNFAAMIQIPSGPNTNSTIKVMSGNGSQNIEHVL